MKTPAWWGVVCVIAALPVFQFPMLLGACPDDLKVMLWLYPIYVVMSSWLAWRCYGERPTLAWILIILSLLSHPAMWYMTTTAA